MIDSSPLRPVRDDEFGAWTLALAATYGYDRGDGEDAVDRPQLDLTRALAAFDGAAIIGGAASYPRVLTVPGTTAPIAAVSWVGVAPTHRRRGILTAMMRRQLTDLHEANAQGGTGEAIAVLTASEGGIYGRYGYGVASRLHRCLGEKRSMGFRPGVDVGNGTIRLLDATAARPLLRQVFEATRPGSAGRVDRPPVHWDARLNDDEQARAGATVLRCAVHEDPGGAVTGYAIYRYKSLYVDSVNRGEVLLLELESTTPAAYAALWQFLIGIDLYPFVRFETALDEALPHLLVDANAVRTTVEDNLRVRLIDVDRALVARRYATPLDVVLEVSDAFCPWNAGRYRLLAEADAVTCQRTAAPADLRLSSTELGAAFLGGTTLTALAGAGRVEELRPGALAAASTAFRGEREPFYPGGAEFPAV